MPGEILYRYNKMVTSPEIEEVIAQLHKEGKGTREISAEVHKNFTYVGAVLRKRFPEEYENSNNNSLVDCTAETWALMLFKEGKQPTEVAILLNADSETVLEWHNHYLRLEGRHSLVQILDLYRAQPHSLLRLLKEVKRSKIGLKGAAAALKNIRLLEEKKRELQRIDMELWRKMMELAGLELNIQDYHTRNSPVSSFRSSFRQY